MKRYKIGIVTPTYPPKGGGIATAHFNIYQLLKDEHEVKVYAYNDIPEKNEGDIVKRKTPKWLIPIINLVAGIYLKRFRQKVNYVNVTRILQCAVGAWLLNKPIRSFAPDFLIVPDNNVPLYWIRKGNYKILWFTRNNYLRFRNNPLISNYNWLDLDIACSMERRALSKADAVLSPSQYMIGEYHRAFKKKLPIYVIHNFIFEKEIQTILHTSEKKGNKIKAV
ncbi:MAG: glycosyltransferase family 4 protein, partial [Bacteroidetes bacterium]|nr:glycosyltransferase family 4 protein [Bacteroidota bacterium]